ncbi:MAG: M4 family metallopeptidase [Bacteroidota bacterium]
MKRIILLLFGLFLVGTIQAQLKTVVPGNAVSSENQAIVPPASKLTISKANRASDVFQPKTIDFKASRENGLHIAARNKTNQLPILIKGEPAKRLIDGDDVQDRCNNFLENAKNLMQIQDPLKEFKVLQTTTDDLGHVHVKMQQHIGGIPVYGSEIIYHENLEEVFLNGRYTSTPALDTHDPKFSNKEAEQIAIKDLGGISTASYDKFGLFDFEKVKSELVVYEGKLAYHLTIYKSIIDPWEYFVDAISGEVLHKHTSMCRFHNHKGMDAQCNHERTKETTTFNRLNKNSIMPPPNGPVLTNAIDLFGANRQINAYVFGGVFYMIDASRTMFDNINSSIPDDPIGAVWTIDAFNTSPSNSSFQFDHVTSNNSGFSGMQSGVSAQYNGGQAYMYFKNIHGRESINGQGGNVIGLVNVADEDGSSLGNAFWNGVAMFYGNGDNSFFSLARGLDVAGHEMSHGVIQSTANLEYQGESGALNESFADIFGAMIDREDWLIGEDVVKTSAYPSGALRSLEDPHNGAATGDFNSGWQPKLYSERFTGSQDNGGVHINSGIPNYAYYLFATSTGVGIARAEKVFYRALDVYLTKSSQFIDARLAVVQAAQDLYGSTVASRAREAFDAVEIFDGSGTNNQNDVEINPGDDLILFTTEDQNNLYIADRSGNLLFDPLTTQDPLSVPSITDDGTEIVFVNQDKKLYYIRLDWETNSIVEEGVLGFSNEYRNVVFSRDGLRMAVLRDNPENEIFVFDWNTLEGTDYELFNPTFTQGVSTGDVLYADAMQFDFSGEFLMYDAFNRIQSPSGSEIDYWDIGFIKVFNNSSGTFTQGDDIQKLFSQLPDGVSVGNPTFSKNSDYIIAFDYLAYNEFSILGTNTETGDIGEIFTDNGRLGYPSYSNDDDIVIFNSTSGLEVIGGAEMASNKIQSNSASVFLGFQNTGVRWGVWFGNGDRVIADVEEELPETYFQISPNPASETLQITISSSADQWTSIRIVDMMGRTVYNTARQLQSDTSLDVSPLPAGQYVLTILTKEGSSSKVFVKR